MDDKAISICSQVHGASHLHTWERYALASMMQPDNLPALRAEGVERIYLDVFTTPNDSRAISEAISRVVKIDVIVNIIEVPGNVALATLQTAPRLALERGSRMWLLPADQVWGNGSVLNVWRYARGKPVTVAAGHLRVDTAKWLAADPSFPLSNRRLVDIAFELGHQTHVESWSHADRNGTFGGGISLTRLGGQLIGMVHWLPSPWLIWFTPEDVEFLSVAIPPNNSWDHALPGLLVGRLAQGFNPPSPRPRLWGEGSSRWRVVGSSDIAFTVELTGTGNNHVLVEEGRKYFEGYYGGNAHNWVNGCIVSALVGEG